MPKHMRDENTLEDEQATASKKAAKATTVCEYCEKMFTARGMSLHLKKCPKKQAHDKAAAKKTRAYKFTILNEAVHEEILSFLSNQSLTKMQMITGDRYQQCEPELARFCCKCENDNPVIQNGMCRQGLSKRGCNCVSKIVKDKYGVPQKVLRCFLRYEPLKLEKLMIEKCGSKMKWLRHLAKLKRAKIKARATRQQKRELKVFLETLAPKFDLYVKSWDFKETNKEILMQCSQRYIALTAKLQKRGLELRWDSNACMEFVIAGNGNIEDLVANEASFCTEWYQDIQKSRMM